MDTKEILELKHRRAVLREALDTSREVVEPASRELLKRLQELSAVYAGPMPPHTRPMPADKRGLYKAWALKREAFEFLVVESLQRATR